MRTFVKSLSGAILGFFEDSIDFDLIGLFLEMLLESVIGRAAAPDDLPENRDEFVFDTSGHACLVLRPGSGCPVYELDDKHLTQRIHDFLRADFSHEIGVISRMFIQTNRDLSLSSPFFPNSAMNLLIVRSFHDLHLSFVEKNPGPSGDEFLSISGLPDPFVLSSIKDPDSHSLLRPLLTEIYTFAQESLILMRFQVVSRSDVNHIKATLRPSGPFLLPLSEPHQSEDGTIFVKSLEKVITLSEFMKLLVSKGNPTVMMWYIESILGVEARLNLHVADSPLQRDDIVVNRFFRFLVNPLSSLRASPVAVEHNFPVTSEIGRVTSFFVELVDTLEEHHLIVIPSIRVNAIFHSIGLSAITSIMNTFHLHPISHDDLKSFPSIMDIDTNNLPSSPLSNTNQWVSDILHDLEVWYSQVPNQQFDLPLLKDSLSRVLFQLLSECRALLDNDEESVWQDFVVTLRRRAKDSEKELDTTFLTDDIFKIARSSILAESQHRFTTLEGTYRLAGDPISSYQIQRLDPEAPTVSSRSEPIYGSQESFVSEFLAHENGSILSTELSLVSNRTNSLQTSTPNPLDSQRAGGELRGRRLSHTSVNTIQLSPIAFGPTNCFPDFAPEDDTSKFTRQTEEERQIQVSLHEINSKALKKHNFSWNYSVDLGFVIERSQIDVKEQFDHTLFNTEDNNTLEKRLQRCINILQKTGRVDHLDLTHSFVDQLCDCLCGDHAQCCQSSFLLLLILFEGHFDCVLQQRVLWNLKDAFLDRNHYQVAFLLRVHLTMLRSSETFSYSDVNWTHLSSFKTMDYNVRLAHIVFVRDAVVLFRNRCSVDVFNPKVIVGRLVDNYTLFSLTPEEVTNFSKAPDIDYLTSLFTSIVVFSLTINRPLPPQITELYASTAPQPVALDEVSPFLIPLTRNTDTKPFSDLLLGRFIRHRCDRRISSQLHFLSLGVKNNHFDSTSLLVILHPFFISHLWHLDLMTMIHADDDPPQKTIRILLTSFSQFRDTNNPLLILYAAHPPPQFGPFLDSLISFHNSSQGLDVDFLATFSDFVSFCAPFGDGQLYQHLTQTLFSHLIPNGSKYEDTSRLAVILRYLRLTNTWLPKGFENPLLRFITPSAFSNRSLESCELLTLKNSVVGRAQWSIDPTDHEGISRPVDLECLCMVARMGLWQFDYFDEAYVRKFVRKLLCDCFSPFPAFVSVALLALSNIVANTGPSVHRILSQMDAVDVVMWAVAKSLHLDDYEAGLRITSTSTAEPSLATVPRSFLTPTSCHPTMVSNCEWWGTRWTPMRTFTSLRKHSESSRDSIRTGADEGWSSVRTAIIHTSPTSYHPTWWTLRSIRACPDTVAVLSSSFIRIAFTRNADPRSDCVFRADSLDFPSSVSVLTASPHKHQPNFSVSVLRIPTMFLLPRPLPAKEGMYWLLVAFHSSPSSLGRTADIVYPPLLLHPVLQAEETQSLPPAPLHLLAL
ncbi:hypothetical protein BLNAU_21835 [Blattamonas nauphoetae]|uniref:Uncharacterized protein n=1 Tax=Blattamonas nauphoetae TaxID=2049346 RepID=A0ABQ9WVC5_9EUKA|nr:hypothetical protein BLNAU_21835 [Blattamonas nauphoetae]